MKVALSRGILSHCLCIILQIPCANTRISVEPLLHQACCAVQRSKWCGPQRAIGTEAVRAGDHHVATGFPLISSVRVMLTRRSRPLFVFFPLICLGIAVEHRPRRAPARGLCASAGPRALAWGSPLSERAEILTATRLHHRAAPQGTIRAAMVLPSCSSTDAARADTAG
jgi:hypothetical protein